ncbi:TetR/AcrR family transcriptional regulator [Hoeflea sp. G2-23]|uniref:TetR/AcrR family transcriptional regulator n=1 Tax=Hoeflea algicola TaxID=2983763 RepID=A0ABT3Z7R6_9HYPH|nr:TetR/AcrR family transcriptional regulator [Hoeflea algicola]MCY0147803.1 TetR/AcrR family transcriptional regulator [Hoeflea algicola]
MNRPTHQSPERGSARTRLLEAARDVIRQKGFTATSVDDLCSAAEVTKGAFFHHFKSKETLGVEAANYWSETTGALFAGAPYHEQENPLDRVLAYIDFRRAIIGGETWEYTCLVGTMTQELHDLAPAIRDACADSIFNHAATLEADISAAMQAHDIKANWTAASLARHTQAAIQGGFILAKASGDPELARETVDHLRRYIEMLFGVGGEQTERSPEETDND